MEQEKQSQSLDSGDTKAGFRKPSNDATNRKYRRRSPPSGSSSDGSPRQDRSSSPMISKEGLSKDSDSRRRKADGRDMDRSHTGRNSDSYKSSDHYTSRSSRDYRRHDDHDKRDRHKSYSDRARQENDQYRSRDSLRNNDRNYSGHRSSRDREKETLSTEYNKYNDSASYRTGSGKRHAGLTSEDNRSEDNRDARKDYMRNSGDRKSNHTHLYEESKGHRSETSAQKNTDALLSREASKVIYEEMNDEKNNKEGIKKDSENLGMGRTKDRYVKDQGEQLVNQQYPSKKAKFLNFEKADGGQSSSLKQSVEVVSKVTTQPALTSDDIDAAKVAAIKVAETVNRNLIGTGFMTADQKKKLLWGNKKNTASEELPGNRWDSSLFTDRERQEKFNKLMGVKGGEQKTEGGQQDHQADKQREEQLQLDLEKQYTAGLRRRDGRTVGLGL